MSIVPSGLPNPWDIRCGGQCPSCGRRDGHHEDDCKLFGKEVMEEFFRYQNSFECYKDEYDKLQKQINELIERQNAVLEEMQSRCPHKNMDSRPVVEDDYVIEEFFCLDCKKIF